jgi:hypothetical protein
MMRKDREQRPPTLTEAVNALDPDHAIAPPAPSKRSIRPSVLPANEPVTGGKLSTPDALAATFTPEFERVRAPTLEPARTSRRPLFIAGVLVLAAVGIGGFIAMRGDADKSRPKMPARSESPSDSRTLGGTRPADKPTASVAPAPAPAAAPVQPSAAAPTPPVGTGEPASAATAHAVDAPPVPAEPKAADKVAPKKPSTNPAAKPMPRNPDEPSRKGDIIPLSKDAFKNP